MLTIDGLAVLLESRNKAEPVNIITDTPVKMNKGRGENLNPYYEAVRKLASRPVWIGCNYESVVNRQRVRESQPLAIDGSLEYFHSEDLWHGKGVMLNQYIARHIDTGELYLAFKPQQRQNGSIIITMQEYYNPATGDKYTPADIGAMQEWIPKQGKMDNQEVDRVVYWQILKLTNLKQITISGIIYTLE